MTRRNRAPARAGFTLIELLVVIAIIAIMVALLLPAIGLVRTRTKVATTKSEIAQIGNAIAAYKAETNMSYIPTSFKVETNYTDAGSDAASATYLKQLFPQVNLQNTGLVTAGGYTEDQVLDGNQCLVFFLTGGPPTQYQGFSTNKQQPFVITTGSQTIGPFLEVTTVKVTDPDTGVADFRFRDPWGNPYAYFAHIPSQGANTYTGTFTLNGTTVTPYQAGGKYLQAKSYQIISAGANGLFGSGGTNWTPGTGEYSETGNGGDDISNFSEGQLVEQPGG